MYCAVFLPVLTAGYRKEGLNRFSATRHLCRLGLIDFANELWSTQECSTLCGIVRQPRRIKSLRILDCKEKMMGTNNAFKPFTDRNHHLSYILIVVCKNF